MPGHCLARSSTAKLRRQHGEKFDEVVTEEGLAKHPYMVTVRSDSCGLMVLLCVAAMQHSINHVYLPLFSLADNPVEGVVNHFKTDVASVLLSAITVDGGITEVHVRYATEYAAWM